MNARKRNIIAKIGISVSATTVTTAASDPDSDIIDEIENEDGNE